MQLGAVIVSILVGSLYHKFSTTSELLVKMTPYQSWWYNYGGYGFGIPIIWVIIALYVYSQEGISDSVKFLVFWSGVLEFIALAVIAFISLVRLFLPDAQM